MTRQDRTRYATTRHKGDDKNKIRQDKNKIRQDKTTEHQQGSINQLHQENKRPRTTAERKNDQVTNYVPLY